MSRAARGRRLISKLANATVRVERRDADEGTLDDLTGLIVPAEPETVWTGQVLAHNGLRPTYAGDGGRPSYESKVTVRFPVGEPTLEVGDFIVVTAHEDGDLVGVEWRVEALDRRTYRASQMIEACEVQA